MHGGELSPIKWDAAKRHMTPLVRSWPGVLEADPVMQQNMTLLSSFFFYFSFFFFASWQPQRSSSSTGSEAAIAARMKSSGLQLRLPLRFLLSLVQSVFSSSVFPLCRPFSLLPSVSFLSPPTLSFLSTSLLLSTHAFFPSFGFLAPTHSSSYTCTPCSVLSNSSHTLLFVLSPLPSPSLFSHFTSGSSWVSGQVF